MKMEQTISENQFPTKNSNSERPKVSDYYGHLPERLDRLDAKFRKVLSRCLEANDAALLSEFEKIIDRSGSKLDNLNLHSKTVIAQNEKIQEIRSKPFVHQIANALADGYKIVEDKEK